MFNKTASYLHIPTHILRRFVLSVVIFFLIAVGWLVYSRLSQDMVTINVNDQRWDMRTNAKTVQSVLDEAQIDLESTDRLSPALTTPIKDGMQIKIERASQLVLDIDGEITRIYTHETNVLAILEEQSVPLNSSDKLSINHQTIDASLLSNLREKPNHIQIIRAKAYTLNYHGETIAGTTTALTVGDLLYEENVELFLADEVNLPVTTSVYDTIAIQIITSAPVLVRVDGVEWHTRIIGTTVGDVLTALGLSLTGQDYSIPAEDSSFEENMTIEVVRVVEIIEVEHNPIPYETILVIDEQLSADNQEFIEVGIDGIEETRWRIRQENGEEVSRFMQSQFVIQEPVPQIIVIGSTD